MTASKNEKKTATRGSKKEVVKNYSKKPLNFETYFFSSSDDPEEEWRKFQKYVKRRHPIANRVSEFIKALANDFHLKPQVVGYLEDCFRGYSPEMQLSMFSTLHE